MIEDDPQGADLQKVDVVYLITSRLKDGFGEHLPSSFDFERIVTNPRLDVSPGFVGSLPYTRERAGLEIATCIHLVQLSSRWLIRDSEDNVLSVAATGASGAAVMKRRDLTSENAILNDTVLFEMTQRHYK